ncbi:MAG: HD domain-containing protein [Chloroflexota bacterium]|nr:HD domain-containing protein [Chloroflexota bacterium]
MTSKLMRIAQLVRSWQAKPLHETEIAFVRDLLNEKQATLYFSLVLYEQRHALNVCQTLVRGGFGNDRDLLQAALLHDLGKRDPQTGRYIPLWGKCVSVALLSLGGPKLVARCASPNPQSWRYLFYLQNKHEERSAQLALEAGSNQKVVGLVGDCPRLLQQGDTAAKALQWADDLN